MDELEFLQRPGLNRIVPKSTNQRTTERRALTPNVTLPIVELS